jgi:hypothetical protein
MLWLWQRRLTKKPRKVAIAVIAKPDDLWLAGMT